MEHGCQVHEREAVKPATTLTKSILSSGQYAIAELFDFILPTGQAYHFTSYDFPLPGISISPEVGVELEILMDRANGKLKIKID